MILLLTPDLVQDHDCVELPRPASAPGHLGSVLHLAGQHGVTHTCGASHIIHGHHGHIRDDNLVRTGATGAWPVWRGARPAWRAPPGSTGRGPLRGRRRSPGRGPHRTWCSPGHWRWSRRGRRAGRGRTSRGNASSYDNCSGSFSGSDRRHSCKRTGIDRNLDEKLGVDEGTGGESGDRH